MIQIIRLNGLEKKLYPLLGPLVMNPEVLRFNNNYPFKTGEQYEWYIAVVRKKIVGFVPVEHRKLEWIINNYYAHPSHLDEALSLLIRTVVEEWKQEFSVTLSAVVQTKHLDIFTKEGFETTKSWKIYHKMQKTI